MPQPLRHPVHADELITLLSHMAGDADTYADKAQRDGFLDAVTLIQQAIPAVFDERDRKANRPIPTAVGDLIPGSMVNLKTDDGYGRKRSIKGATVGSNPGVTTFDPASYFPIHLSRGGQSLRVMQREIVEIEVVSRREPVFGG